MDNKQFLRVTVKQDFERPLYEHEFLLSFFDDLGAEAFGHWWIKEGNALFCKWVEGQEYYKDLKEWNDDYLKNK